MADNVLGRNEPQEQQQLQRQLSAAISGAVQVWETYSEILAQCTPEMIRQVNTRLVDELSKINQQVRQGQPQQGQQLFGTR